MQEAPEQKFVYGVERQQQMQTLHLDENDVTIETRS